MAKDVLDHGIDELPDVSSGEDSNIRVAERDREDLASLIPRDDFLVDRKCEDGIAYCPTTRKGRGVAHSGAAKLDDGVEGAREEGTRKRRTPVSHPIQWKPRFRREYLLAGLGAFLLIIALFPNILPTWTRLWFGMLNQ